MKQLTNLLNAFIKDEEGATAVEYGVLIALIIAACVVIINVVGERVNNAFARVANKLPTGS